MDINWKDWRFWVLMVVVAVLLFITELAWGIEKEVEFIVSPTISVIGKVEILSDLDWITRILVIITF